MPQPRRPMLLTAALVLSFQYTVVAPRPLVVLGDMPLASHQFARPRMMDAATGRPVVLTRHHTREAHNQHSRRLRFSFENVFGRQLDVMLERSDDLLGANFTHSFTAAGNQVTIRREEIDHCFYHGWVVGEPGSAATAFTCGDGFEASIRTSEGEHYASYPASRIQEMQSNQSLHRRGSVGELGQHLVVRASDYIAEGCSRSHVKRMEPVGANGHRRAQTTDYSAYVPKAGCKCLKSWAYQGKTFSAQLPNNCGNPDGSREPWCFTQDNCGIGGGGDSYQFCEKKSASSPPPPPSPPSPPSECKHHIELLIGNDSGMFEKMKKDMAAAQEHAILIANGVKTIYSTLPDLGVCVTLVAVKTFRSKEEEGGLFTSKEESLTTYLKRWTSWVKENSKQTSSVDLRNDNAALLTNIDRSGGTAGLGWVGTMCNSGTSSSVNEDIGGIWQFTAETVAHEMGHNLGCGHDGTDGASNCDKSEFIMAAVGCGNCQFKAFKKWSACSKTYITNTLQDLASGSSDCTKNNPRAPVCSKHQGNCSFCGDYIVSSNETCDAGASGNSLCQGAKDEKPCTFKKGVVCAKGECCTSSGQYKSAGSACRSAANQCDLTDTCSGSSADCGADTFKKDGTACSESGPRAKCFKGSCIGLDKQCANAFTGFSGTWVAHAQNGVEADCLNECGELRCTNTKWSKYCDVYDCPEGYSCTVNGKRLDGPVKHSYCKCDTKRSLTSSNLPVNVLDGTPCGTKDEDKICLSSKCVKRMVPPPPPSPQPVNCTGAWGSWGSCSRKCGGGKQSRQYTVKTEAQNGGDKCGTEDGTKEERACNRQTCPVDCVGGWSPYGKCSKTCGGGNQSRTYSIKQNKSGADSKDCVETDKATQFQDCNKQPCNNKVDCSGSWGEWGSCTRQCGGGNQTRSFSVQTQQQNGGQDCKAKAGATQQKNCNQQACPVDCVGEWGNWESCSKTCGGGIRSRAYTVTTNAKHGGQACAANAGASQQQSCNTNKCGAKCDDRSCKNGRCAAFVIDGKVQKYLKCKCEPGWTGAKCDEKFECSKVDCQKLHRERCVAPNKCGSCLESHSHIGDVAEGKPCTLENIRQHVQRISANSKTNFIAAADGKLFTVWRSLYEQQAVEARKPALSFYFKSLADPNVAVVTHYALVSADSHPAEDPKDWKLECRRSSSDSEWQTLDTRVNQRFEKRHQSQYFAIKQPQPCIAITLRLLGIRDSAFQGGASLTEMSGNTSTTNKTSNATTRRNQTTSREIKSYQTKVHLAEVQLWRTINYKPPLPENSLPAEVTLAVDTAVAREGPTRDKFESQFMTDMASVLGVDTKQIRIESITAGSIIVKFFVLPDLKTGKAFTTSELAEKLADKNARVAGSKVSGLQGLSLKELSSSAANTGSASEDDEASVTLLFGAFLLFLALIGGIILGLVMFSSLFKGTSLEKYHVSAKESDAMVRAAMAEGVPPGDTLQDKLPTLQEIRAFRRGYLKKSVNEKKLLHSKSFVRMVHDEFEHLDINHAGALDRAGLEHYVEDHYGHGSKDYIDGVFDTFDRDNDGTLSEAEFRECVGVLQKRWGSSSGGGGSGSGGGGQQSPPPALPTRSASSPQRKSRRVKFEERDGHGEAELEALDMRSSVSRHSRVSRKSLATPRP